MSKHIIWSNINIKEEEWKDEDGKQMDYTEILDLLNLYIDDERDNLDIELDNPIIIIASLGLWNGRRSGYRILESKNIKDILYSNCDYVEWYVEDNELRATAHHHDGTNYYRYREVKDIDKVQPLLSKLYNNEEVSEEELSRHTNKLGKRIQAVYGWE